MKVKELMKMYQGCAIVEIVENLDAFYDCPSNVKSIAFGHLSKKGKLQEIEWSCGEYQEEYNKDKYEELFNKEIKKWSFEGDYQGASIYIEV